MRNGLPIRRSALAPSLLPDYQGAVEQERRGGLLLPGITVHGKIQLAATEIRPPQFRCPMMTVLTGRYASNAPRCFSVLQVLHLPPQSNARLAPGGSVVRHESSVPWNKSSQYQSFALPLSVNKSLFGLTVGSARYKSDDNIVTDTSSGHNESAVPRTFPKPLCECRGSL